MPTHQPTAATSPSNGRRPTIVVALTDALEAETLADRLRRFRLPIEVVSAAVPTQARIALEEAGASPTVLILDLDTPMDRELWLPWLRMSSQVASAAVVLRTTDVTVWPQFFSAPRMVLVAKQATPAEIARQVGALLGIPVPEFKEATPPSPFFRFATAAIIWMTIGLTLGTFTLVGPAEFTAAYARTHGWPDYLEHAAIIAIIVLLALGVTLVSLGIGRTTRTRARRLIATTLSVACAVATIRVWMEPGMLRRLAANHVDVATVAVPGGAEFVFGPLPQASDMALLRAKGYAGVIMLLHPAVVPVEPAQIKHERDIATRTGMRLIEAPMLPWVSSNDASLARIRELSATPGARYYVHCYLGRDRVRIVQRFLLAQGAKVVGREVSDTLQLDVMERGLVTHVEPGVVLGPLPTEDELVSVILERSFVSVLSLLDAADSTEAGFLANERRSLQRFHIVPVSVPLSIHNPDTALVRRAVEQARALPGPLYIHAFRADTSARIREFLRLWHETAPAAKP